MESRQHQLADGRVLLIREAEVEDVRIVLDYVNAISTAQRRVRDLSEPQPADQAG
jgi:hypothetical protein